jgi:hypothetical protein
MVSISMSTLPFLLLSFECLSNIDICVFSTDVYFMALFMFVQSARITHLYWLVYLFSFFATMSFAYYLSIYHFLNNEYIRLGHLSRHYRHLGNHGMFNAYVKSITQLLDFQCQPKCLSTFPTFLRLTFR